MSGTNNLPPPDPASGRTMPAERPMVTPELLRAQANDVEKCARGPTVAPTILRLMADLMASGNKDLDTPKPCPTCGHECRPCSGAHPAYDLKAGKILRIAIIDYLCVDCPTIWAHWWPLEGAGKPSTPVDPEGNDE